MSTDQAWFARSARRKAAERAFAVSRMLDGVKPSRLDILIGAVGMDGDQSPPDTIISKKRKLIILQWAINNNDLDHLEYCIDLAS